ncbi:unnamed protein product [Closterium sp. NIES-64]|nr:unnamed protein product [Closterium sp. NIES-64]
MREARISRAWKRRMRVSGSAPRRMVQARLSAVAHAMLLGLIKERQAIGAFRYHEVVVMDCNLMLRLADEVLATIVEKGGIGGTLERWGSGDLQGGFSRRRTRRNGRWRGFAGVIGCRGLEGLRAAEEDVEDAVRSDECILENTADAPDEGVPVDRRAVRGKLKLVDGGGVNGRGERGRSGSHERRRRGGGGGRRGQVGAAGCTGGDEQIVAAEWAGGDEEGAAAGCAGGDVQIAAAG